MGQRRPSPEIFCNRGIFGELSSPASPTWGSGIGFGLLSSLAPLPYARFERGLLQQFAGNIDWFLVNTLGSLIAIGPDTPVGLPDLTASSTPFDPFQLHHSSEPAFPNEVSADLFLGLSAVPRCASYLDCEERCARIFSSTHTHVRLSVNRIWVIRSRRHPLRQLPLPVLSELILLRLGSLQSVRRGCPPANSLGSQASWTRGTTNLLPLDGLRDFRDRLGSLRWVHNAT